MHQKRNIKLLILKKSKQLEMLKKLELKKLF